MAEWPTTLPSYFLNNGFSESPPDLVIRTKMDQGPDKIRRKGTAGVRPIDGTVAMTKAQIEILDDFYVNTLSDGALRFDWTHPRTGTSLEFRFTAVPTYLPQGGALWWAQIPLEVLP